MENPLSTQGQFLQNCIDILVTMTSTLMLNTVTSWTEDMVRTKLQTWYRFMVLAAIITHFCMSFQVWLYLEVYNQNYERTHPKKISIRNVGRLEIADTSNTLRKFWMCQWLNLGLTQIFIRLSFSANKTKPCKKLCIESLLHNETLLWTSAYLCKIRSHPTLNGKSSLILELLHIQKDYTISGDISTKSWNSSHTKSLSQYETWLN